MKIITTEKEKGKGFNARTKEKCDNTMPEYRFFDMKNLRDKFAKLPVNMVENSQKIRQRENTLYKQGSKNWFKDAEEGRADKQGYECYDINMIDLKNVLKNM